MVKESVWIIDNNNVFPPIEDIVSPANINIIESYIVAILFICYWSYIYYKKQFKYNSSIIIGCISSLLLIYLYHKMSNYTIGIYGTKNKWIYNYTQKSDMRTDLKSIKINKLKFPNIDIDIKKDGYLISKEYFDKLKKQQEFISINNYENKTETSITKNTIQKFKLDKLNRHNELLIFQGFCLITILFTIFSLVWNINKKVFKQLFYLFIQAVSISIPFILITYWYSNIQEWLFIYNIKAKFLFLGVSITLAILSELITLYSSFI